MRKKILVVLFITLFIVIAPLYQNNEVSAVEKNNVELFRWSDSVDSTIKLSNSNKTLYIDSTIMSINNELIKGNVYLERYTYGGWVSLKSWSISGNGTAILTETYSSSSGGLYRARLSATVNGERISAVSDSVRL